MVCVTIEAANITKLAIPSFLVYLKKSLSVLVSIILKLEFNFFFDVNDLDYYLC